MGGFSIAMLNYQRVPNGLIIFLIILNPNHLDHQISEVLLQFAIEFRTMKLYNVHEFPHEFPMTIPMLVDEIPMNFSPFSTGGQGLLDGHWQGGLAAAEAMAKLGEAMATSGEFPWFFVGLLPDRARFQKIRWSAMNLTWISNDIYIYIYPMCFLG